MHFVLHGDRTVLHKNTDRSLVMSGKASKMQSGYGALPAVLYFSY